MAYMKRDLWGTLDFLKIQATPLALLREQASLLDEKSSNRLRGEVISRTFTPYGSDQEMILHILNVVVPGLKNRRQELLRATHNVKEIFPVNLIDSERGEKEKIHQLENIKEFEEKLSNVLSGERIRLILEKLFTELNNKAEIVV